MIPDLSLTVYGGSVEAVSKIVPELNLRSNAAAWTRNEYEAVAEALGFSQPLMRARGAPETQVLSAFTAMLRANRPQESDAQAWAQTSIIRSMSTGTASRWRVMADPTTLEGGACFDDGATKRRAFYPDTAPGYFGPGWLTAPRASSACGWTTPLVLHLGTFPYVYSSRVDGRGPGLKWIGGTSLPAVVGLQVALSFMDPATNLREDARSVASILDHFISSTATMMAPIPVLPRAPRVGELYQRDGLLVAHQASLEVYGLSGPRGRISAPAYNYIIRRFACFFAVRRAALRALPTMTDDVRSSALASDDPSLRELAAQVLAGA